MKRRYTLKQESAGSWSVIDVDPDKPAPNPSLVMSGLAKEDALDAAELLNKLEAQRPGGRRRLRQGTYEE